MKKVKIGLWLLLIAFLLLAGFQNKAFFLQKHSFDLNLWVTAPYQSAEIYNAVLFGGCFLAGLVIAYISGLFDRFKANKTIKQLTNTINDQKTQTEQLKTEIEALKTSSTQQMATIIDANPEEDNVSASTTG
jgi:outer membrane murein-binding lipoprotein Lpp